MMYSWLEDEEWILSLAFLHDIFEQLNKLNLRMQGKDINIIIFVDELKAFKSKLANWKEKWKCTITQCLKSCTYFLMKD